MYEFFLDNKEDKLREMRVGGGKEWGTNKGDK